MKIKLLVMTAAPHLLCLLPPEVEGQKVTPQSILEHVLVF